MIAAARVSTNRRPVCQPVQTTRLNWAKQSTSTNRTNSSKKSDPFICAFLTRIADAKGLHDAGIKPVTLLLAKIEEAERRSIATPSSSSDSISIWLNTIWLAVSAKPVDQRLAIVSLQVMMAIAGGSLAANEESDGAGLIGGQPSRCSGAPGHGLAFRNAARNCELRDVTS
jgi:hypothetical protein